MATLGSLAELADHLQRDITELPAGAIQALEAATATIHAYTGQTLTLVTDDQVTLTGPGPLWLPQVPVVTVTAVTVDSVLLAATNYEWTVYGRLASGWRGRWSGNVVVTYTHGYDSVPYDIRAVCWQVAARMLSNPYQYPREQVGQTTVSYPQPASNVGGGISLLDHEERTLDAYRPLVVV